MIRTSSMLVFACASKACAPPPVGVGGSKSSGSVPSEPVNKTPVSTAPTVLGMSREDWAATKSSRRGIMDYYEGPGFKFVNGSLRGMTFDEFVAHPLNAWNVKRSGIESVRRQWDEAAKNVELMDQAFRSAHRLSRDTVLYRGMTIPNDPNGLLGQLRDGAVLTDRGFISTSVYPDTASAFTDSDLTHPLGTVPVVFEIVAPKGTRVVAGSVSEQEAVLNRNTSLRIVSATKPYRDSPEMLLVRAEVVDDQA